MVQLPQRSRGLAAARRLFDRTDDRTGDNAQPSAPEASLDRRRPHPRARRRVAAHRRPNGSSRTYVRRVARRDHHPARSGRADSVGHRRRASVGHRRPAVTSAPAGTGGERTDLLPATGTWRLIRLVTWYQRAVEGRPSPCRFTPSCSSYACEALTTHGTGRGIWLSVRRLARCRPFGPSGYDPVPLPGQRRQGRHDHGPVSEGPMTQ